MLRQVNPETGRISFQKIPKVLDLPYLIDLQRSSYEEFLAEGIHETFQDISPVEDFTGNLVLEFLEHTLEAPTYTVEECRDRDATYARPLKVRVRLITKEGGEIKEVKEQDIFMGDFPCMTEKGTFVINGAERVIVSQLVRSPGIYFDQEIDLTGKRSFSATLIPNRGAWLEFVTTTDDIINVSIDKARKLPATVLLRAIGFGTDDEIRALFNNEGMLEPTLEKDPSTSTEEALIEIYRKQRPGDPPSVESASALLTNLFFSPKRYNLAKVGRYKLSRKLGQMVVCEETGVIVKPGTIQDPESGAVIRYPQTLAKEDLVATIRFLLALMKQQALERPPEGYDPQGGIDLFEERGLTFLKPIDELHYPVPVRVDDIDHLGNRRIRA
ncbi:MAG: DNA-directed RNA polymerase subunit beta, partial [Candidatus Eremiobacteraeota bacterium]|nr:DNA-directed RNA polymerase subunit beta [Candidatus Eremiobacteraeota bacterium]